MFIFDVEVVDWKFIFLYWSCKQFQFQRSCVKVHFVCHFKYNFYNLISGNSFLLGKERNQTLLFGVIFYRRTIEH